MVLQTVPLCANFTLVFIFYLYLCLSSCVVLRILHCPLSGPDLAYISLLIIFCIIEYVTNKKPWNFQYISPQNIPPEVWGLSRYILTIFSRALKSFWVGVSPRCYCMDVIVVFQCLSDIRVMNSDLDWCKRGLQFLQCHAWVITGWVLAMLLEEFWKVKPFLGRFIFFFFFFGDNGSHCVSDFCPNVLCFHMLSVFPCPY